jgi:hypothetical protein
MTDTTTDKEHWPTRKDAAEELTLILGETVSVNSMMSWLRQSDCPLPAGRGPIPKRPLIKWAQERRSPGPQGKGDDYAALELQKLREEVRKLQGVNARLYDESVNAEDARGGVVRAVEELRRELTQELPSAAWEASQGKPVDEAVPVIRSLLTAALNRFHDSAKKLGA